MHLEVILAKIMAIKTVLATKYHVSSVGVFGSIVRPDFNPKTSDIDILVDFSRPIGVEFIDLAEFLELELNFRVDLVSKDGVKEKYLSQIQSEVIYV